MFIEGTATAVEAHASRATVTRPTPPVSFLLSPTPPLLQSAAAPAPALKCSVVTNVLETGAVVTEEPEGPRPPPKAISTGKKRGASDGSTPEVFCADTCGGAGGITR